MALPGVALAAAMLAAAPHAVSQRTAPGNPTPGTARPSLLVVEVASPAAVAKSWQGTRLARLLSHRRMQNRIQPIRWALSTLRQVVERKLDDELDPLVAALASYRGRLVVALRLLHEPHAIDRSAPPQFGVALLLTPDGTTDLDALGGRLQTLLREEHVGPIQAVPVGDETISAWLNPIDGGGVSTPRRVEQGLVVFAGKPLAAAVASFSGQLAPLARRARQGAAAESWLSLRLDGAQISAWAHQELAPKAAAQGYDAGAVLAALGVASLGELHFDLGPSGEHVVARMAARFDPASPGLFDIFRPAAAQTPRTAALLGTGRDFVSLQRLDPSRLWKLIRRVTDLSDPDSRERAVQTERNFESEFGARLHDDLLRHLGDEVFLAADVDDEAPSSRGAPACWGISLKNPTALRTIVQTMLDKNDLRRHLASSSHAGETVHRLGLGAFSCSWSITEDLAVVGLGIEGDEALKRALDGLARPDESLAVPGIRERLALVPGWSTVTAVRMQPWLAAVVAQRAPNGSKGEIGQRKSKPAPRLPTLWRNVLATAAELLDDHGLDHAVVAGRAEAGRCSLHWIW